MRSTGGMKTAAAVTAFLILIITIYTSTVEGQETERESVLSADSSAELLAYIVNRGVTKSAFGGGSYLIVKFNRTLTFGVVYGNTRMKGPISIFTISSIENSAIIPHSLLRCSRSSAQKLISRPT